MTEPEQLENLRETHHQKLSVLEQLKASFGTLPVPPHITIQMRDLTGEITSLQAQPNTIIAKLSLIERAATAQDFELLITQLKDSEVRFSAKCALTQIGAPAVSPLIAALNRADDKDGYIRYYTVIALTEIGEPAVLPLIAALKDENYVVRFSATDVLGDIGDTRAVKPFISALKLERWEVRHSAVKGLGKLGDSRAVEPIIAALEDIEPDIRASAAEALGQLGDTRALPELERMAREDIFEEGIYGKKPGDAATEAIARIRARHNIQN